MPFIRTEHHSEHGIHPVTYDSGVAGGDLLITGVFHGTEPCGQYAIDRACADIENYCLNLVSGSVTFIPVCNPEALKRCKRYIDKNLNTDFFVKNPQNREEHIVAYLRDFYEGKDGILDLHSHPCQGQAFALIGNNSLLELAWSRALGVEFIAYNFPAASDKVKNNAQKSSTSTNPVYARSRGASAVLVECGEDGTKEADEFAYYSVIKTLQHWNITTLSPDDPRLVNPITGKTDSNDDQKIIRLVDGCRSHGKDNNSYHLNNINFSPMRKGELIASFNDRTSETAPFDGYAIMPHFPIKKRDKGMPLVYYGTEEDEHEYLGHNDIP